MANPLAPGVKLNKRELNSQGGITSRTIPGNTNFRTGVQMPPSKPFSKQGNVTSGSVFPASGNHDSLGGDSGSYRIAAKPRFMRLSRRSAGFGAVKRPNNPRSPKGNVTIGNMADRATGNFGAV